MAADPAPGERPYLGPGASPATIGNCLLPEDRERFREACRGATVADDSQAQHDAIERWRGIAMLQADPVRYAATVRRVAERKSGRPVPVDEPLSATRRVAGM